MVFTPRNIYFLLFALSGFSGLIYESIWTHYLKLFLGHAAYAQTLVLAIFMGGMAIGSWLCSQHSVHWKNLLLGYALTEGVIGVCALLFHAAFTRTIEFAYTSIIPQMGNPLAVSVCKWALSALMILPQSILLGMTFPLMSAAILRLFSDRPGRSIALLYFTNSIGAAIGVLASGFLLIRLIGLPGTMSFAGLINITLALTVWLLVRRPPPADVISLAGTSAVASSPGPGRHRLFLLVSLVTGAASFIYEMGWIRMLSLVLGTSTHAFELMLSAFIFGLAFGGLWIQRRIDFVADPSRYLAWVQVAMGALALSTLPLYGNSFEVMQWIVRSLPKTDPGYLLFNLSGSAIAMAIMLPATFCAGMTLPLITYVLIRQGHGERSIGAVYAANTVGAIIGVFFAIHLGMPLFGLKGLITFGAGLDIALGAALFWKLAAGTGSFRQPVAVTLIGVALVSGTLLLVHLDPYKMASGVYRYGTLLNRQNIRLIYYKDGKTATVSMVKDLDGSLSINTNGKTDASIMMAAGQGSTSDEATAVLLSVLPMAFNPGARSAAAIGLGSGLTTQTLLGNPRLTAVDTVEIEKRMVEGANNFRPYVEGVYTDPRSRIHLDDAKTFFSTWNRKYDLIVSEPSNPWVSGVSGLFSGEFYRLVRRHMNEGGMFVQWVQLYEINTELVISVLKAVSNNFPDYAVYAANDFDMIIVAGKNALMPEPDPAILKIPAIAEALQRIHINGDQDIAIRKIGTKKFLGRLIENYPVRANSDYYPVIDQNAARTRFLGDSAAELLKFPSVLLPALEMLSGSTVSRQVTMVTPSEYSHNSQAAFIAMALRDFFIMGSFHDRYGIVPASVKQDAARVKELFSGCGKISNQNDYVGSLFAASISMVPYLSMEELDAVWHRLEANSCSAALSPAIKQMVSLFKAIGRRDARDMSVAAETLLAGAGNMTPGTVRFLVASAMLGEIALGDKVAAARLWSRYKEAISDSGEPDLLFRLLAAESSADL